MSLDIPLFPINAISLVPGHHAGLKIPSIFSRYFFLFPDFKSTIKSASDFPDFAVDLRKFCTFANPEFPSEAVSGRFNVQTIFWGMVPLRKIFLTRMDLKRSSQITNFAKNATYSPDLAIWPRPGLNVRFVWFSTF